MTAAVGLYLRLGLPQPWAPSPPPPTPLLIYGAASSVGFYALQLARRSNIHPIICVAGRACDHVRPYLDPSKGDAVLDYRQGDEALVRAIVDAVRAAAAATGRGTTTTLRHVLDAVSEGSSIANIGAVFRALAEGEGRAAEGKVTFVLSGEKEGLPEGVEKSITMVGDVHKEAKDFGYVYFRYFARGLQERWFRAQRTEVVPGGLAGIQTALENLKAGRASAVKYVFRIEDTEGAGK